GHAAEHLLRRTAQPLRPVLAHQIVVAADTAAGHDHGGGLERELALDVAVAGLAALGVIGRQDRAAGPDHGAVAHDELVHPVPELELDQALLDPRAHGFDERLEDGRPGTPDDVEARDGVAVPGRRVAAALG